LKSITGTSRASRTSSSVKSSTFTSADFGRFRRRRSRLAGAARAERLAACFFAAASAAVGASTRRQPSPCGSSSPLKRLRPLNGSFRPISTCCPAKRAKSAAVWSGRSSPGRGNLEPLVGDAVDLEHVLELPRHLLAVVDLDEALGLAGAGAGWSIVTRKSPPGPRSTSTRS
jgi:hypothetical protein